MRRQRHSSPSPAQSASTQSTEEDGHAKGAGQAGTNSAASSHVWCRAKKKKTCQTQSPQSPLSLLGTIATTQGVLLCFFFQVKLSVRQPELFFHRCNITRARISTLELPLRAQVLMHTSAASHLIPRARAVNSREKSSDLVLLLQPLPLHNHPASTSHLSPKSLSCCSWYWLLIPSLPFFLNSFYIESTLSLISRFRKRVVNRAIEM